MEALQKANVTLEEKNIMFRDKEEELSALSRRIMLLEGEANNADLKLANTTMEVTNLSKHSTRQMSQHCTVNELLKLTSKQCIVFYTFSFVLSLRLKPHNSLQLATESKRADKVIKVVNALNSKAMTAEVHNHFLFRIQEVINQALLYTSNRILR